MGYGLGIDLGTTYTAAAVSGSSPTHVVALGTDGVVPSVVFADERGALLTGARAAQAATLDPACASWVHKRHLGDPEPLWLGGVPYSPATLMAAQLRDVIRHVVRVQGASPDKIVLTCPAVWGPYRREHFDDVPKLAGAGNVRIITEPEAAATHYAVERRLGAGDLVAVYDLGGGTFDTTIMRALPSGMEILGTPQGIESLGGVDFDHTLLAHLDDRLDGAISDLDQEDPEHARLLAGIYGRCVRAKEILSKERVVTMKVPLTGELREIEVTRSDFNDMIRPLLEMTIDALDRTIESSGIGIEDLAGVLLAGGSSRIPLVSQLVSKSLGKPVHLTLDPKLAVSMGAAAAAHTDLGQHLRSSTAMLSRLRTQPQDVADDPAPLVGETAVRQSVVGFHHHSHDGHSFAPPTRSGMTKWARVTVLAAAAIFITLVAVGTVLAVVLIGAARTGGPPPDVKPRDDVTQIIDTSRVVTPHGH